MSALDVIEFIAFRSYPPDDEIKTPEPQKNGASRLPMRPPRILREEAKHRSMLFHPTYGMLECPFKIKRDQVGAQVCANMQITKNGYIFNGEQQLAPSKSNGVYNYSVVQTDATAAVGTKWHVTVKDQAVVLTSSPTITWLFSTTLGLICHPNGEKVFEPLQPCDIEGRLLNISASCAVYATKVSSVVRGLRICPHLKICLQAQLEDREGFLEAVCPNNERVKILQESLRFARSETPALPTVTDKENVNIGSKIALIYSQVHSGSECANYALSYDSTSSFFAQILGKLDKNGHVTHSDLDFENTSPVVSNSKLGAITVIGSGPDTLAGHFDGRTAALAADVVAAATRSVSSGDISPISLGTESTDTADKSSSTTSSSYATPPASVPKSPVEIDDNVVVDTQTACQLTPMKEGENLNVVRTTPDREAVLDFLHGVKKERTGAGVKLRPVEVKQDPVKVKLDPVPVVITKQTSDNSIPPGTPKEASKSTTTAADLPEANKASTDSNMPRLRKPRLGASFAAPPANTSHNAVTPPFIPPPIAEDVLKALAPVQASPNSQHSSPSSILALPERIGISLAQDEDHPPLAGGPYDETSSRSDSNSSRSDSRRPAFDFADRNERRGQQQYSSRGRRDFDGRSSGNDRYIQNMRQDLPHEISSYRNGRQNFNSRSDGNGTRHYYSNDERANNHHQRPVHHLQQPQGYHQQRSNYQQDQSLEERAYHERDRHQDRYQPNEDRDREYERRDNNSYRMSPGSRGFGRGGNGFGRGAHHSGAFGYNHNGEQRDRESGMSSRQYRF